MTDINYNAPGIEHKIVAALHAIARLDAPYPPELLAARKAAVLNQFTATSGRGQQVTLDTKGETNDNPEQSIDS